MLDDDNDSLMQDDSAETRKVEKNVNAPWNAMNEWTTIDKNEHKNAIVATNVHYDACVGNEESKQLFIS